jgi:predicted HTH domain antitoxin
MLYQSCSSRISKTKPSRSPSFSLWISEASSLEHIALIIIFSIYSIELELHDRKVCLRTYVSVRLELNYHSLKTLEVIE